MYYTDEALSLLGEQLDATSRMTWQNRIRLGYLLAEKGGVLCLGINAVTLYQIILLQKEHSLK